MNVYQQFWDVCRDVDSWEEFLEKISSGKAKGALLEVIAAGWKNRLQQDLLRRFKAPNVSIDNLMSRLQDVVEVTALHSPVDDLLEEFMRRVIQVNVLRGYLRYANYTQCDEPDDIIWTLDTELSELGSGTPTREECAKNYSAVTGRTVHTGGLVIPGKVADRIATYLAAQLEELQRHFQTTSNRKEVVAEMRNINELHAILTGKSLLGSNLPKV